MKYVITESQLIKITKKLYEEDSKESKVKKIQQFLVDKGYDLGDYGDEEDGVDGEYGRLTRKAVEDFQKKEGDLKVDGKVGPKTAEAMGKDIEPVFGKKSKDIEDEDEEEKSETKPQSKGSYDAILVGGLDYRKGDYPIDKQVEKLKKNYSGNVKGFRYNTETSTILNFLKSNTNVSVFLFSAGCNKAKDIAKSGYVDLNKIYIIEPYAVNGNSSVSGAVNNGVPARHVFVGDSKARGKGVVSGAVSSESSSHWGALEGIGELI
jgi:peptidoglycan hydrolase-like protein with peptidoglycan-binding domain